MKVKFFASLREALNTDEETWTDLQGATTVADVLQQLHSRGDLWVQHLKADRLLVSVNQEISDLETAISLSDEVAFMPPVTGG